MEIIQFNDVLKTYAYQKTGESKMSKYKSWFPIIANPRLAGLVADLMADGHLQKSQNMWRMDYVSSSIEELERFNTEIKDLFNISGYVRPCTTNAYGKTYLLAINCNQLGRVMSLCGVPRGAKVFSKFTVPTWILNDKECFRKFIQRLVDCEGTIDTYGIGSIEIRMNKELSILDDGFLFFESIKNALLNYFSINTTNIFLGGKSFRKDEKVTQALRLKIRRKADIMRFAKEITLDSVEKQRKVNLLVDRILKKSGLAGI